MNFKFHTNNGDNRFAGATFPAFPVKWDWSTNGWIKTTKNDPDAVWGVDSPTGIGPIGQPVSGFGVFVYGDGTPADVPIDENLPGYAAVLGRKGGSVKSERKAASSRENGRLGGRPSLANKASARLVSMGYSDLQILLGCPQEHYRWLLQATREEIAEWISKR